MKFKTTDYFRGVQPKNGFKIFIFVVFMALFEVAGIASIMPFIGFLGNSDDFIDNTFVITLTELSPFKNDIFYISAAQTLGTFSLLIITTTLLIRSYTTYKLNIFIENTRHMLSTGLMEDYLNVSYKYIINSNSSLVSKAILSEVDQYIAQVFRPLILMGAYTIVALFILFFLILYNWQITLFVFIVFGLSYTIVYKLIKNLLYKLGMQSVSTNESRFSIASEVTSGIKAVKIFGSEDFFNNAYYKASKNFAKAQAGKQSATVLPNDFIEFLVFGGTIISILIYILYFSSGNSDQINNIFAPLTVFALAAYRLKPALFNIFVGITSIQFGNAILTSLTNLTTALKSNKVNAFKRQDPIKFASVKIKNLTFRYNNSLQPVLNNLELEIKKGDFLGIIGHSGSGKSTLVDILIGLLEPESAVRTIDGLETDANNRNWRSLFGYVPQDIYILDENFYSNVAFGEEKNEIDRDRVIDSCKKANLHDFITSGKNGYDASLGERGVKISGGQRQRLGIARALYFDPKILILDEGTSALDEKTEEEILNGLHSLKDSISIIMITHKASTLKFCDKVIELKTTL